MIVQADGHEYVTVTDMENCTFWFERARALAVCGCGAQVFVVPETVDDPNTLFHLERA